MDKEKQQVIEECSKAGIDPELELKLKHLESRRITPETVIPPKRYLFRMFGKPCFPRGEIVAITGKKKCGKTFFSSILMTLCARKECMSMQRNEDEALKVLWIDTEQSEESTQEILVNRILAPLQPAHTPILSTSDFPRGGESSDTTESLNVTKDSSPRGGWEGAVFNLRADNWNDRLPLIEMAARETRPDLFIFDGIRDVVDDINNGVMAQEVLERIMHLASDLQCCICCVLHQNKSLEDKTLRGVLGTELGNKCFEEYECKKDGEHRIFEVSQVSTRKYDIMDKLMFTVEDNGLPRLLSSKECSALTETEQKPSAQRVYNPEYVHNGEIDSQKAFDKLLPAGTEMRATQLQNAFMELVGINSEKWYGRERAKALEDGTIQKRYVNANEVYYLRGPKLDGLVPMAEAVADANSTAEQPALFTGTEDDEVPF